MPGEVPVPFGIMPDLQNTVIRCFTIGLSRCPQTDAPQTTEHRVQTFLPTTKTLHFLRK